MGSGIAIQVVSGGDQDTIKINQISAAFQAEANKEGGRYTVGPDFMNFVSLATSSAHVDGVRFVIVTGVEGGLRDGRGGELLVHERSRENEGRACTYRSVLDRGLRLFFGEDGVEEDDVSWTG